MAPLTTTRTSQSFELQPSRHSLSKDDTFGSPLALSTSHRDPDHPSTTIIHDTAIHNPPPQSNLRLVLTILQPSLINFFTSFTNGIITVGLPTIALSLSLPRSLYTWPSSVYGLTSGSILLLAGSVSDLIGARNVELTGCFLVSIFTIACGFSQTGIQLVMFRALQGIAMAMHLPSSVAIVASAVPQGRARNIGFACLGLSQPFGFSVGLVASGVMIDRVGWRSGFYLSGGSLAVVTAVAVKGLPKVKPDAAANDRRIWRRLYLEVDWVGGLVASGGLAMLSYVLAVLSADLSSINSPTTATLLPLSIILLIAFPFWMNYRTHHAKPALVPNTFWRNTAFTATCIMVLLSYGVMNSMELFSSLYFQEVQASSPLSTSLKLLPNLTVGTIINLTVGLFVHRVPALWLVTISSLLASVAPLLMAVLHPEWNYFYAEFWAQLLSPMSADVLFTVGLIVVSEVFPEKSQGLAGAVFNTVGQFGLSLGTGVCQLVALGVAGGKGGGLDGQDKPAGADASEDLLKGYQASFWTMFACMLVCACVAAIGLRRAGKVGVKRE